jgi:hypothetical protein
MLAGDMAVATANGFGTVVLAVAGSGVWQKQLGTVQALAVTPAFHIPQHEGRTCADERLTTGEQQPAMNSKGGEEDGRRFVSGRGRRKPPEQKPFSNRHSHTTFIPTMTRPSGSEGGGG